MLRLAVGTQVGNVGTLPIHSLAAVNHSIYSSNSSELFGFIAISFLPPSPPGEQVISTVSGPTKPGRRANTIIHHGPMTHCARSQAGSMSM